MKSIVTLGIVILMNLGSFAQAQAIHPNPFPKTITVSGSAEMDIIPDEI